MPCSSLSRSRSFGFHLVSRTFVLDDKTWFWRIWNHLFRGCALLPDEPAVGSEGQLEEPKAAVWRGPFRPGSVLLWCPVVCLREASSVFPLVFFRIRLMWCWALVSTAVFLYAVLTMSKDEEVWTVAGTVLLGMASSIGELEPGARDTPLRSVFSLPAAGSLRLERRGACVWALCSCRAVSMVPSQPARFSRPSTDNTVALWEPGFRLLWWTAYTRSSQ